MAEGTSQLPPKVPPRRMARSWAIGRYALLITLVSIVVVTAIGNPRFLSFNNLSNILFQVSTLGIVAAGQTLLMIAGGLDLSVGASLSVAGLATALTILATGSAWLGVLAGLATGALIGLCNGVLISSNRASPFIVTLGTMTFLQGVAIIISGGSPINGAGGLFELFGLGSILRDTQPSHCAGGGCRRGLLRFAADHAWPLRLRHWWQRGGGAAFRHRRTTCQDFTLRPERPDRWRRGRCAPGILDSALPNMGTGYELRAIAAVVIGGTPLFGGRGTVVGTLGGVLLLGLVSNSMNCWASGPTIRTQC